MIRKNTWLVLLLLAVLVGGSFYLRDRKAKLAAEVTPTAGSATLFGAAEGSPTGIKIENSSGTSVELARDQSGKWVLKAPTEAAADQAAAEAAATQIGALRVLATVQLGPDVVGLDKPTYTVTVVFGGTASHRLSIGSVTPVQNGYYVQVDGGKSQVVDKFGLDALLDLLTQPPYVATLTPVPSATPSLEPATPTMHASLTPPASVVPPTPTSTP
jgi:hypothetical protein